MMNYIIQEEALIQRKKSNRFAQELDLIDHIREAGFDTVQVTTKNSGVVKINKTPFEPYMWQVTKCDGSFTVFEYLDDLAEMVVRL